MTQQVVNTAMCTCTMGTAPATFLVLPANCVNAGTQPAANIMDNIPITNITPFVMCNSQSNPATASATASACGVPTPGPCSPVTAAPWSSGAATVMIGKKPALNSTSTLDCSYGGTISITTPGQFTVNLP